MCNLGWKSLFHNWTLKLKFQYYCVVFRHIFGQKWTQGIRLLCNAWKPQDFRTPFVSENGIKKAQISDKFGFQAFSLENYYLVPCTILQSFDSSNDCHVKSFVNVSCLHCCVLILWKRHSTAATDVGTKFESIDYGPSWQAPVSLEKYLSFWELNLECHMRMNNYGWWFIPAMNQINLSNVKKIMFKMK